MDIRDINKTIEMNKLKKSKRKCKIIGLVWFGTSAITAGILAPILLAQPNNNTNTETGTPGTGTPGTGTPGTGTPTNNLKTGYVYGGHIYDSEDGAKGALATYLNSQGSQTPAMPGTLDYDINQIHQPETFISQFTGATPDAAGILAQLGTLSIDTDPNHVQTMRSGEKETILSFEENKPFVDWVAKQSSINIKNPFIHFSLKPSLKEEDFVFEQRGIHLGRHTDKGWRWSGGKLRMLDKSHYDASNNFVNHQSTDTVSDYWYPDKLAELQFHGETVGITGPKRIWGKPGQTLAQYSFRFTGDDVDLHDSHHNQMVGPSIYVYTNLTEEAFKTQVDIAQDLPGGPVWIDPGDHSKGTRTKPILKECFLKEIFDEVGDTAGVAGTVLTDPTEIAAADKIYNVYAGMNLLGQIKSKTVPSVPTASDINIHTSTVEPAVPAQAWTATTITSIQYNQNVTVVPDVEFTNGEAWPKP